MKIPRLYASTGGAALLLTAALTASLTGGPATADQDGNDHRQRSEVKAHLDPLNNSGVTGEAEVKVKNHRHLDIEVEAAGLLAGAPMRSTSTSASRPGTNVRPWPTTRTETSG